MVGFFFDFCFEVKTCRGKISERKSDDLGGKGQELLLEKDHKVVALKLDEFNTFTSKIFWLIRTRLV